MGVVSTVRRMLGQGVRNETLTLTDARKEERLWARALGAFGSAAGKTVTIDSALQVSTVWACVRLISETIATLPVGVYRREADGGRTFAAGHPLADLLRVTPDGEHTAVEFIEGLVLSMCLNGNAYAEKVKVRGRLIALHPLRHDLMSVTRNEAGALSYEYADPAGRRVLSEDEVFHVRGFGGTGATGLSPISFARQTIGASIAADEIAARLFANGVRPAGVLEYDKVLTAPQREDIRKNVLGPLTGSMNAGGVFVLEAGMKFSAVSLNPQDVELLATRRWHVEEICRWFGVPPILVGHAAQGQTMWGSGVESIMLGWLVLGLRSYLKRIEAAIQLQLIEPGERATVYAEFAVEGLLRADSAGRAELYSKLAQNGVMTRNEIREKENLPRKNGGDDLTVQSNLLPIEKLGEVVAMSSRETPVPSNSPAARIAPTLEGPK